MACKVQRLCHPIGREDSVASVSKAVFMQGARNSLKTLQACRILPRTRALSSARSQPAPRLPSQRYQTLRSSIGQLLISPAIMSLKIPAHLSTNARPAPPSSGNDRTYRAAIDLLNTCQSNAATIEAIRKSGGKMNQFSIPEMEEYLRRLGYTPDDLNRLNVVHITGTKGKGSASAFVERIFREGMKEVGLLHAVSDVDHATVEEEEAALRGGIGLYTSPHLCAVRERIRVNGRPLPERLFAKYFFEVWDKLTNAVHNSDGKPSSIPLKAVATSATGDVSPLPMPTYPVYFRFLTLLAFHVFLKLDVRLTVLEVGVGGTYDSTNLVPRPLIAGVTALGLDHQILLGNTIEEIARNKGGIYKAGVKALSIEQENGKGEQQLREMAEERGAVSFEIVPVNAALRDVKLGEAAASARPGCASC